MLFFGAVFAILNHGGTWSWWALLWAPLLSIAIGSMAYEWRLLARRQWRMNALEWVFLVTAHVSLAALLAGALGILSR
ncbi:hypothetical protein MTF65_14440 [Streptomyces sp. APSN-46.1]|uniref:hypothetical protein n=1 Tax=Streptomyces sp. APSN-46.1 TaxID=2929049 RepID=UPI001FB3E814|nr:hypothetical protein [Streptomyces sp. APSN-46.1]MCJ1678525.1 hypothetical protein [Streptomyces sp. APSN-46.1]